jgi:uncharacterized protein (UPF0297 family)
MMDYVNESHSGWLDLIERGSDSMQKSNNTQYFKVHKDTEIIVSDVIRSVYAALTEKGYNPLSQIVGYVMSGDPTYITSHKGARSLIMKVERDEIVEELLRYYIDKDINSSSTR